MNVIAARELLIKYNNNLCTPEEKALVEKWEESLLSTHEVTIDSTSMAATGTLLHKKLLAQINQEIKQNATSSGKLLILKRWWTAAAIFILLATGLYFWLPGEIIPKGSTQEPMKVSANRAGAILTLANGTQVILDTINNGLLATEGGVTVKMVDKTLLYEGASKVPQFNKITTPIGKQYHLTLPDGTKVWLNAASSIRYPTSFTGNEREVELQGEAYFEVAMNANQIFLVATDMGRVQVLGTSFNVNAYADENAMKTTLFTGAVKVSTNQQESIRLTPGWSLKITDSTASPFKDNLDQVLSWKHGYFNFTNAAVSEVMRQLARWYDVTIEYTTSVPNRKFGGEISRDLDLQEIIAVLRSSKIKCWLEGRRLIVE